MADIPVTNIDKTLHFSMGTLKAWKARVNAVLPSASGYPPLVVITEIPPLPALVGASAVPAVGLSSSSRVAITVRWRLPQDTGADPVRNHTMITEVRP